MSSRKTKDHTIITSTLHDEFTNKMCAVTEIPPNEYDYEFHNNIAQGGDNGYHSPQTCDIPHKLNKALKDLVAQSVYNCVVDDETLYEVKKNGVGCCVEMAVIGSALLNSVNTRFKYSVVAGSVGWCVDGKNVFFTCGSPKSDEHRSGDGNWNLHAVIRELSPNGETRIIDFTTRYWRYFATDYCSLPTKGQHSIAKLMNRVKNYIWANPESIQRQYHLYYVIEGSKTQVLSESVKQSGTLEFLNQLAIPLISNIRAILSLSANTHQASSRRIHNDIYNAL